MGQKILLLSFEAQLFVDKLHRLREDMAVSETTTHILSLSD